MTINDADSVPSRAKILIYDIENMANLGWAWGLYDQNLISIEHHQHLLIT